MQLHITSAATIVDNNWAGEEAHDLGLGIIHDLYPTNSTQYNTLQRLSLQHSKLKIPTLQFGECLHGVGSYRQSMFPQSLGLAASFDVELVKRVGRAIGSEARSIGIGACLSPVLDLGLEPRWGRVQEAWGEDVLLTSQMGVAMASGLSKNGDWGSWDAVVPIVKRVFSLSLPAQRRWLLMRKQISRLTAVLKVVSMARRP
jgi:beta-glucosidase-like glycosyl hydrolase